MEFNELAKLAVKELTDASNFQIQLITYDAVQFGNALISLTSPNLKIRYVLDRGEKWCEIGRLDGEWFTFNDVMDVLGIKFYSNHNEFIDWVGETSTFIKNNLQKILNAFNDAHFSKTEKQLEELTKQRTLSWFNQKKV